MAEDDDSEVGSPEAGTDAPTEDLESLIEHAPSIEKGAQHNKFLVSPKLRRERRAKEIADYLTSKGHIISEMDQYGLDIAVYGDRIKLLKIPLWRRRNLMAKLWIYNGQQSKPALNPMTRWYMEVFGRQYEQKARELVTELSSRFEVEVSGELISDELYKPTRRKFPKKNN